MNLLAIKNISIAISSPGTFLDRVKMYITYYNNIINCIGIYFHGVFLFMTNK